MWMNVKVFDVSENAMTMRQSFWREFPQLVFNLGAIVTGIMALDIDAESLTMKYAYGIYATLATIWGLADIVVFLSNEKRRALHDYIAGTVVIKTETE
jgi:uncharacterized RDD family membrane protein YckC